MSDSSFRPDTPMLFLSCTMFAVLLLAAITVYCWRFRQSLGARYFMALSAAALGWGLTSFLMAISDPPDAALWLYAKILFIGLVSISMLMFALDSNGLLPKWRSHLLYVLLVVPLGTQIVMWTPNAQSLMFRELRFVRQAPISFIAEVTPGPVYWFNFAQGYLLSSLTLAILLVAAYRATPFMRARTLGIAAAFLVPYVANFVYVSGLFGRTYDPMPIALAVTAGTCWWIALRHDLKDLVPVARNVLLDEMAEAVLAVDARGQVIDMNRSMAELIGVRADRVLGRPTRELLAPWPHLLHLLEPVAASASADDVQPVIRHGERHFSVRLIDMRPGTPYPAGRLLVLHDLTDRMIVEQEREELIAELRGALAQVKTLKGLLPICAQCKKIRDRDGAWQPADEYIRAHSQANVSHGMCPQCREQPYPAAYR